MDYKIDDNVKISELSVTDNEIRTLARKVIDSEHIIRSVVIITSSQKKWEEWNSSAISEKFIFLRAHSVHELLEVSIRGSENVHSLRPLIRMLRSII